MVSTVAQSQHVARLLIWAAEGISVFTVFLDAEILVMKI